MIMGLIKIGSQCAQLPVISISPRIAPSCRLLDAHRSWWRQATSYSCRIPSIDCFSTVASASVVPQHSEKAACTAKSAQNKLGNTHQKTRITDSRTRSTDSRTRSPVQSGFNQKRKASVQSSSKKQEVSSKKAKIGNPLVSMQNKKQNVPPEKGPIDNSQPEAKRRKIGGKKKGVPPEVHEVRLQIIEALKNNNIRAALNLYDGAKEKGIQIAPDSLNTLLFLCAGGEDWQEKFQHLPIPWGLNHNVKADGQAEQNIENVQNIENGSSKETGQTSTESGTDTKVPLEELQVKAQQILKDLKEFAPKKGLSEITYTGLARLEAAGGDADRAFQIAREGQVAKVPCRLRTFLPAMLAYTVDGNFKGAMKVAELLKESEVDLTETEHAVLLLACQHANDPKEAEAVIKRVGTELTFLHAKTISAAEAYFRSSKAQASLDEDKTWQIERCTVNEEGQTSTCGGILQALDLDAEEWKEFESCLVKLAMSKERQPNDFKQFQAWLSKHGPFTRIIDGANIAYFGQNYEHGDFQFSQIGDVVETLTASPEDGKPLVILHVKRTKDGPAQRDDSVALLKALKDENLIYPTPYGSNDDWYWMYATVKAGPKGMIVSNDEMRDHIFQMLAPRFFLKWKQRHQMKYKFGMEGLEIFRPAKYTSCTQKLSNGSWVFPIADSDKWLCARPVG